LKKKIKIIVKKTHKKISKIPLTAPSPYGKVRIDGRKGLQVTTKRKEQCHVESN